MLIKLTRTNGYGERKECLINSDKIIGITEKHTEPTNLYDEDGNVVETRETPKVFEIVLEGGVKTIVDETAYNELVKALVK